MAKNKASVDQFQTQHEEEDFGNGNEYKSLPLTIFYDGKMKVYNAISQEKAEVIMLIASAAAKATRSASPAAEKLDRKGNIPQDDMNDELPLARSHSLRSFLEKRHERKMEKAPYSPSYSAKSLYVEGPSRAQRMPPFA